MRGSVNSESHVCEYRYTPGTTILTTLVHHTRVVGDPRTILDPAARRDACLDMRGSQWVYLVPHPDDFRMSLHVYTHTTNNPLESQGKLRWYNHIPNPHYYASHIKERYYPLIPLLDDHILDVISHPDDMSYDRRVRVATW